MAAFDDRAGLRKGGYSAIATNGKLPAFANWQQMRDADEEHFRGWAIQYPTARNTSILTENVPTFDIDIRHPAAAQACEDTVRDWIDDKGSVLVRFGQPPKRAIPFRANEPFSKISRTFRHPNDKPGDKAHRLEFLCNGQQVVVAGIHPDTGKEYSWHGGSPVTVPRDDLPYMTQTEAQSLLDLCADTLIQQFDFVECVDDRSADNKESVDPASPFDPLRALAELRAEGGDANDKQPRIIMSL